MSPRRAVAFAFAVTALGALAASAARAAEPNAGVRSVTLGMQRDARHNQSVLGTLSLPVGQRGWVQAAAGTAG